MIDPAPILAALEIYCVPGQVLELRALGVQGHKAVCQTFNELRAAATWAARADEAGAMGVYFTPNPLKPTSAWTGGGLKAADVLCRHWLLIDCDPRHPAGTSASDPEHEAARNLADRCSASLGGLGLVAPVVADSGNGWHLCYPVDLPNDDAAHELVKAVLRALDHRHGDPFSEGDRLRIKARQFLETPQAGVGVECHDAPRIWKLSGTTARKGQATAERPHRVARLVEGRTWDEETARHNTARLPGVLAALLDDFADLDRFGGGYQSDRGNTREQAYVREALRRECQAVAGTAVGTGLNAQLNTSAFAVGKYVQPGLLAYEEAGAALYLAALQAGANDPRKDKATIARGLRAGMLQPWDRQCAGAPGVGVPLPPPIDTTQILIDRASDITPRAVEWLWPAVIPLGKLTTFAGAGGLGKTFVLLDITARVTVGAEWLFSGSLKAALGQVLFISGEDDPDDTLVPRLLEMGADLRRVTFLKAAVRDRFTLADLKTLEAALRQTGADVRLVVIDPPTAYLGGVDDHKNAELRALLSPLARFASFYRIAIIFNTHLNKQAGKVDALMRVMGSVAWVNAVRAAHLFTRDPDNPERRFFLPMKMNLAPERLGLAYRIQPTANLARVEWLGEVNVTADEAVHQTNGHVTPRQQVASDWLIERFRERLEWTSEELFQRARSEGVSRNALFEAKRTLDLPKPRKSAGPDGSVSWLWWVPGNWPALTPHRNSGTVGENGPNP